MYINSISYIDGTTLLVAGGFEGTHITSDVEVVSLSGESQSCTKPENFPTGITDVVGSMVTGRPTICGGMYGNIGK